MGQAYGIAFKPNLIITGLVFHSISSWNTGKMFVSTDKIKLCSQIFWTKYSAYQAQSHGKCITLLQTQSKTALKASPSIL